MAIMKHFLGNPDHPEIGKPPDDPERSDTGSQSLFFQKRSPSQETDADVRPDLPLYVSSKGYFFH